MTEEQPDIDAIVAQLAAQVRAKQESGSLPRDLDEQLESRFASLRREVDAEVDRRALHAALEHQRAASWFSRDRIEADSDRVGGAVVHRATGALVRRQVDGLLAQMQHFSDAVMSTSELLSALLADPGVHQHVDLRGDIDMVDDRVTRLERARVHIDQIRDDVADLRAAVAAATATPPDIDRTRFAREFRGDPDELRARYAPLADRFVGLGPVVDIGCGGGLFLELLAERGVDAWGIEIDEALADVARSRHLDARVGDGVDAVARLGDSSVGGVVSMQVMEHLAPAVVPVLVREAKRALQPGGVLVVESLDPRSFHVQTHTLWLDPGRVHLVHPLYIDWLCREQGFATVEHVATPPMPVDEMLPTPGEGSDPLLGEIVEKLNARLFGPEDFTIVATA